MHTLKPEGTLNVPEKSRNLSGRKYFRDLLVSQGKETFADLESQESDSLQSHSQKYLETPNTQRKYINTSNPETQHLILKLKWNIFMKTFPELPDIPSDFITPNLPRPEAI